MATLQGTTVTGNFSATTLSGSGASLNSIGNGSLNNLGLTNGTFADNAFGRANMNFTGAVLQCITIRYDGRPDISMPTSAEGTRDSNLRLTITPTYSNSLIICEWMISGEPNDHDSGIRVAKNGTVVTTSGFQGYNNDSGQNNHSFINSRWYDPDNGSTPQLSKILYFDRPATTSTIFYEPAFASSNSGTRTFNMNHCTASTGQDNHENGTSFGRIWEIRQ
jgi:hypothetical protein